MPIKDGTEALRVQAAWEARRFTVEEGTRVLVAFLDAVPFETWEEHFIRELDEDILLKLDDWRSLALPNGLIRLGEKSWICIGDSCPLCKLGGSPGYRAAFNVIVFGPGKDRSAVVWIASPGPLNEIEEHAFGLCGPLDRPGNYFVVSKAKTETGRFFKYKIERVTARQARDEFGFAPDVGGDTGSE